MRIDDFGVEMWMNKYENDCQYNLAETCVQSITLGELLEMSGNKGQILTELCQMQMTYGDIEGSPRLMDAVASLYSTVGHERIAITHGAIGANAITMLTLVESGDHVVSVLPTYQQLYSIPRSIGATVDILRLEEGDGFLPSLERLRALVRPDTKLICINNPNNPSGAVMDEGYLREIVRIAESVDAYLLCDEVYRGLTHEGNSFTTSVVDLYAKGISTGSLSKTYSLAGLRMGWLVGPADFIRDVARQRDYHVISCGKINDYLSAVALENKDKIVARSLGIVRGNCDLLDRWVQGQRHISWTRPKGGTTALLKYDMNISSEELCIRLQEETGVMLLPGSVMEMEGYLRIGYANDPQIIAKGLELFGQWLDSSFG